MQCYLFSLSDHRNRVLLYCYNGNEKCAIVVSGINYQLRLMIPENMTIKNVRQFYNSLSELLGSCKPVGHQLQQMKPLTGSRLDVDNVICIFFKDTAHINRAIHLVTSMDFVGHRFKFAVDQHQFRYLQFLSEKDMSPVQSFAVENYKQPTAAQKMTTLEHEWHVSAADIKPIEGYLSLLPSWCVFMFCVVTVNGSNGENIVAMCVHIWSGDVCRKWLITGDEDFCGGVVDSQLKHVQCDNTEAMLDHFFRLIVQEDPCVILGHGILMRDFPLIFKLASGLALRIPSLSRIKSEGPMVNMMSTYTRRFGHLFMPTISGRLIIDTEMFAVRVRPKENSHTLAACTRGLPYDLISDEQVNNAWAQLRGAYGSQLRAARNKMMPILSGISVSLDAVWELATRWNVLRRLHFMAHHISTPIQQVQYGNQASQWHGHLLRAFHRRGFYACLTPYAKSDMIAPNLKGGSLSTVAFEADRADTSSDSIVCSPGLQRNAAFMDFSSAYARIVIAANICYTTIVHSSVDAKTIEHKYTSDGVEYTLHVLHPDVRVGVMCQELETIVRLRSDAERLEKKLRLCGDTASADVQADMQMALKESASSLYGFTAVHQTMEDRGIPQLITGLAREYYAKARDMARGQGLRVIYGDSVTGDSVIIIRKNKRYVTTIRFDRIKGPWQRDGNKEIQYTPTLEIMGSDGWKPLQAIIRHFVSNQLVRVVTTTGCVDATEDHSFIRENGTQIKPSHLFAGDTLLSNDKFPCVDGEFHSQSAVLCGSYLASGVSQDGIWSMSSNDKNFIIGLSMSCTLKCTLMTPYIDSGRFEVNMIPEPQLDAFFQKVFFNGCGERRVPSHIMSSSIETMKDFWNGFKACMRDDYTFMGKEICTGLGYILKMIGLFPCFIPLSDTTFKMELHSCHVPCRVVRVEPVSSSGYVYDASVPAGGHAFYVGPGTTVVHNTDSVVISAPDDLTDPGDIEKWGVSFAQAVTDAMPRPVCMKYQGVRDVIFLGARSYFSRLPGCNKVTATGTLAARRDCPGVLKSCLLQVASAIFDGFTGMEVAISSCNTLNAKTTPWADLVSVCRYKNRGVGGPMESICRRLFSDRMIVAESGELDVVYCNGGIQKLLNEVQASDILDLDYYVHLCKKDLNGLLFIGGGFENASNLVFCLP